MLPVDPNLTEKAQSRQEEVVNCVMASAKMLMMAVIIVVVLKSAKLGLSGDVCLFFRATAVMDRTISLA